MGNTSSSSSSCTEAAAAAAAALAGCSKSTIIAAEDVETGSHLLTIDGYSKIKGRGAGKSINSGKFTVGGHSWYIAYFPDGDRISSNRYISVFVYLDQPGTHNGAIKAQFELNLLKPNGKPIPAYRKRSPVSTFFSQQRWGCEYFVSKDVLESSQRATHDALRIKCDVTVIRENRVETITSPRIAVPPPDIQRHIADLLESQVGADVTFDVRGELFMAHKAVLATRSSVFMAELFGHMKETVTSRVNVDDMDPNVFRAMLHFIYTDSLPKMDDRDVVVMAQHLLVAADKYNLERLKLICEDKLCGYVDAKTLATTLSLAEQHGCECLKDTCVKFLMSPRNLKSLMSSDDLEPLMRICPSLLKELLAKVAPSQGMQNE